MLFYDVVDNSWFLLLSMSESNFFFSFLEVVFDYFFKRGLNSLTVYCDKSHLIVHMYLNMYFVILEWWV